MKTKKSGYVEDPIEAAMLLEGDPKFSDEELEKHLVPRAQARRQRVQERDRQRRCQHELRFRRVDDDSGIMDVYCTKKSCMFVWHPDTQREFVVIHLPDEPPKAGINPTGMSYEDAVKMAREQKREFRRQRHAAKTITNFLK